MRCREWYGWHFPELSKVVTDNLAFAKVVLALGERTKAMDTDLSEYLEEVRSITNCNLVPLVRCSQSPIAACP